MDAYQHILAAVMLFAAAAQIEIGNASLRAPVTYIPAPELGLDGRPCASTAERIDMSCVALLQN